MTETIVNMSTLNCPYGCGAKLVTDDCDCLHGKRCQDDIHATCLNDTPRAFKGENNWTDDGYLVHSDGDGNCEGYGFSYPNADAVVDTVHGIVQAQTTSLRTTLENLNNLEQKRSQIAARLARFERLSTRITQQHG